MPFELNLVVEGDVQLLRSFRKFADNVKDLSEAFREIAQDFHQTVERKQFESEGAYGSGGWAPLSEEYASWKAKNFPGRPLMVLSGDLKESLMGENPWAIEDIQPLQLRLGTKIKYAVYHQSLKPRKTKLPRRPLIDLTEADKKRFTRIVHKHLIDQAKEAGLL